MPVKMLVAFLRAVEVVLLKLTQQLDFLATIIIVLDRFVKYYINFFESLWSEPITMDSLFFCC